MSKGPFSPSQFIPTRWSTAEEKARFGNALLHFVDSGFARNLFTDRLYGRLSNCFGHIAHYVEGVIMREIRNRNYLPRTQLLLAEEQRRAELTLLERLEGKYRGRRNDPEERPASTPPGNGGEAVEPVQGLLF